ncbi:MAG: ABC transporter ATP-binding protein [Nitrososphaerota archaeon]|nr:ABC transporter ATP-binding protein [Nitrososphaerota archaeon]
MESLLSVRGLKLSFRTERGDVRLFDGLNLDVGKGEVLGVVGESGSGKTTLAYSIIRLLSSNAKLESGTVVFDGRDIAGMKESELRKVRGREITMVFQDPSTALNPAFRVKDQMLRVIKANTGIEDKEARVLAMGMLKSVELPDPAAIMGSFPYELSGGMQQRVMIAMALTSNPKLVIADEPTSAVDATIQVQILRLLQRLRVERGFSVLLITHSIAVAREVSDRIAVMYAGDVVEEGEARKIVEAPKHPYTQGLVRCIPTLRTSGASKADLATVPGEVPDLVDPPTGCRFHPRCPFVMDVCRKEKPRYLKAGDSMALCNLYEEKKQ